jgi:hypothetical protein
MCIARIGRVVSHLLEHRVVVPKADQPVVSRLRCIYALQGFQRLGNGLYRSNRRAVQIGRNRD